MLSFLHEQSHEDLLKPSQDTNSVQDQTGHNTQDQGYITVAAQDKKVRQSTVMLAALFGIGLLCLFFMIKKSGPSAASALPPGAEELQMEKAIANLTGVRSEMCSGLEMIVKKFYDFSDVQQKQVEKLTKNPFKYEKFWNDFDKNGANDPAKNLSLQASELELISIMQSNGRNCCMINDKLLYEGESIRGFTIERINDKSVQLKSGEMKIELKLSD
jgi:hypothetical protein